MLFFNSFKALAISSIDISPAVRALPKPYKPPTAAPMAVPHGPNIIPIAAPVPTPCKADEASFGPPACSIAPANIGAPIDKPRPPMPPS